jgi:predicted nucleotidyltransferase
VTQARDFTECGEGAIVRAVPPHHLIARLQPVLQSGPPLHLALLFGSTARGTDTSASDADVAILPANAALSLGAELSLQAQHRSRA